MDNYQEKSFHCISKVAKDSIDKDILPQFETFFLKKYIGSLDEDVVRKNNGNGQETKIGYKAFYESEGIEIGTREECLRVKWLDINGILFPRVYYPPDIMLLKNDGKYKLPTASSVKKYMKEGIWTLEDKQRWDAATERNKSLIKKRDRFRSGCRKKVDAKYRETMNKCSLKYYHKKKNEPNFKEKRNERLRNYRKTIQYQDMKEMASTSYKNSIRNYKASAKQKGLVYAIPELEMRLMTESPCHYCGTQYNDGTRFDYQLMGLDRIDKNEGYTKENVIPCCKTCNMMKGGRKCLKIKNDN